MLIFHENHEYCIRSHYLSFFSLLFMLYLKSLKYIAKFSFYEFHPPVASFLGGVFRYFSVCFRLTFIVSVWPWSFQSRNDSLRGWGGCRLKCPPMSHLIDEKRQRSYALNSTKDFLGGRHTFHRHPNWWRSPLLKSVLRQGRATLTAHFRVQLKSVW
jgi:hypothetical protein